ncbi:hypothetical protein ABNQ38_33830 (plasmid) [Azospirillum sp. A29]|uniref:hypothetical protein n=1 Tax=Azospirillum sp. A29 TaxID=3160606 RepID=UPI00366A9842
MKSIIRTACLTVIFAATLGSSQAAFACSSGFLADLACRAGIIKKETAQDLDRRHAQMGRPLDSAYRAGLNSVVPGAGDAWRLNDEMKRRGVIR